MKNLVELTLIQDAPISRIDLNLEIGLPVGQLRVCIRNCLNEVLGAANEVMLPAINWHGRSLNCQVTCTPLIGNKQVQGVILLMEQA